MVLEFLFICKPETCFDVLWSQMREKTLGCCTSRATRGIYSATLRNMAGNGIGLDQKYTSLGTWVPVIECVELYFKRNCLIFSHSIGYLIFSLKYYWEFGHKKHLSLDITKFRAPNNKNFNLYCDFGKNWIFNHLCRFSCIKWLRIAAVVVESKRFSLNKYLLRSFAYVQPFLSATRYWAGLWVKRALGRTYRFCFSLSTVVHIIKSSLLTLVIDNLIVQASVTLISIVKDNYFLVHRILHPFEGIDLSYEVTCS